MLLTFKTSKRRKIKIFFFLSKVKSFKENYCLDRIKTFYLSKKKIFAFTYKNINYQLFTNFLK